jgi:L-2-hydroxyglutarate oxidase LhgO
LREIEPHAQGVRAVWSPVTGIVDYLQVAASYADEIRHAGGAIETRAAVGALQTSRDAVALTTPRGTLQATQVISCAGLQADRVAALSGASPVPRIVPFRGDYYRLRPERRDVIRTNIYPVPDPRFPFLGVHFTPRTNGEIWLGPNAVLAFSRQGYRFTDVSPRDLWDIFSYGGFLRFGRKHWRTGLDEMARDLSKKRFLASLQRYVPELTMDDLIDGPSGVRAQALSPEGGLVDDFVIDQQPRILHVRNAPSPAATSSLAIGAYLADRLEQAG